MAFSLKDWPIIKICFWFNASASSAYFNPPKPLPISCNRLISFSPSRSSFSFLSISKRLYSCQKTLVFITTFEIMTLTILYSLATFLLQPAHWKDKKQRPAQGTCRHSLECELVTFWEFIWRWLGYFSNEYCLGFDWSMVLHKAKYIGACYKPFDKVLILTDQSKSKWGNNSTTWAGRYHHKEHNFPTCFLKGLFS